jgi:arginyl-tRNA synthetase
MKPIIQELSDLFVTAFHDAGFDGKYGDVVISQRRELCHFQCNGALSAAKVYKLNPNDIATKVISSVKPNLIISNTSIAGAGFINIVIKDEVLVEYLQFMNSDDRLGISLDLFPKKIIIDYGGPNVAKPLHVGHIRSAILGEALKRLSRFLGHDVIGDIHLGDWGLQMGMIIASLQQQSPDLPYFDESFNGEYPEESPVSITDLQEIYSNASKDAKTNIEKLSEARKATFELQDGRVGYRALWKKIVDISITDMKANYSLLDVEFDLWKGESDSHEFIPQLLNYLQINNYTYKSEGASVIDIREDQDKHELPPFMLIKSDGSILYSTTDLSTIWERIKEYDPDEIWYVVDKRQEIHFTQLFRAARKTKIASNTLHLEHIAFGTMNGLDGRPYKTRDGSVMRLNDFIQSIIDKAYNRIIEVGVAKDFSVNEKREISQMVGVSALKFADLLSHRLKDYIFDIDKFTEFEGKTGPYLLYTTVRIKSIIRKAIENEIDFTCFQVPKSFIERELMLKLMELDDVLNQAFKYKEPNQICEYIYTLSLLFNSFYHEHHILSETDNSQRESWLCLSRLTEKILVTCLDICGIRTPERM